MNPAPQKIGILSDNWVIRLLSDGIDMNGRIGRSLGRAMRLGGWG